MAIIGLLAVTALVAVKNKYLTNGCIYKGIHDDGSCQCTRTTAKWFGRMNTSKRHGSGGTNPIVESVLRVAVKETQKLIRTRFSPKGICVDEPTILSIRSLRGVVT